MAGWHHRLDGCESEWTPGVGDGQGGLACCDSQGRKDLDVTEWLNWTELSIFGPLPSDLQNFWWEICSWSYWVFHVYDWSHFFYWFHDSFFVCGFGKLDFNVSWCGSLWIRLLWISLIFLDDCIQMWEVLVSFIQIVSLSFSSSLLQDTYSAYVHPLNGLKCPLGSIYCSLMLFAFFFMFYCHIFVCWLFCLF